MWLLVVVITLLSGDAEAYLKVFESRQACESALATLPGVPKASDVFVGCIPNTKEVSF